METTMKLRCSSTSSSNSEKTTPQMHQATTSRVREAKNTKKEDQTASGRERRKSLWASTRWRSCFAFSPPASMSFSSEWGSRGFSGMVG
uniref:Uncharacterized protein n=1 Tax=Oryza meridionalis TaxID=40149 RepID=A0A0E0CMY0_9ORYZ